jgi:hypothetical protein
MSVGYYVMWAFAKSGLACLDGVLSSGLQQHKCSQLMAC